MKSRLFRIVLFALFISLPHTAPSFGDGEIDHSKWDHILKQYVHEGLVDYQALLNARGELDDYLEEIKQVSVDALAELNREARMAFWINLYNASVIRMILDEYPVKRFDEIPAVFEVRTIQTIGEFFSLADLKDQVLRKGFRDERVLFALVTGRMDSPRLFGEAFQGSRLEAQLDQAARVFVEDDAKNQIAPGTKKVFLSPLFRSIGSDFLLNYGAIKESKSKFSETEAATLSFILFHLKNPDKRLFLDSARYRVDYLPEDPRLNDVHNQDKE